MLQTLSTVHPAARGSIPAGHPGRLCAACPARPLGICAAIEAEDLKDLEAAAQPQQCEAGTTLVTEGDPARDFLNITQGWVKIYKLLPDGRRQITGFLQAGDLLGLAFNGRHTATAEALTPLRFCRFRRDAFETLLDDFPKMKRRLIDQASNELAAAQEQMMLLGRKTATERLASFLMSLVRRREQQGMSGDFVSLAMTRADIADYLGLTLETVSRIFTRMKTQRLLELGTGGKVWIKERAQLMGMAQGL